MEDAHLDRLARLDTCAVSDALDRLGLSGATTELHAVARTGLAPLVGHVATVQVEPRRDDQPRPHLGTTAIEAAEPGTVIVVANDGRTDVSSWGGVLSHAAQQRGVAGVVVDGVCRDVDEAAEIGFTVFSRGSVPVSARGRLVQRSSGEPVTCAGVEVSPGDCVIADGSGVVFVARADVDRVLDLAERIAEREREMVAAVREGRSVVEVMHDGRFDAIETDS